MALKNETIVDRVVERLKTQPLGDLITEEDLHDIVKEAIPKAFFAKQRVNTGSAAYPRIEEHDPIIVEIMRDLLKDSAKTAVADWLTKNADRVADYWKQVCDAGLLNYVQQLQNEQATLMLQTGLGELLRKLNDERSRMGLPAIWLDRS